LGLGPTPTLTPTPTPNIFLKTRNYTNNCF